MGTVIVILFLFCLFSHSSSKSIPILDTTRTDALDLTDAHHVAYGSPINENFLPVPPSQSREFVHEAPEEFLCRQNIYGQSALHLAVGENRLDLVELFTAERKFETALYYASA